VRFAKKKVVKQVQGISMKKCFGQHFLQNERYLDSVFDAIKLTSTDSVFEVGGGEGLLTGAILQHPVARLWVFEVDPEWAAFLKRKFSDKRLQVFRQDFLETNFSIFEQHAPWILLANLPYNITFPILDRLVEQKHLLSEGVIMIQEEVAQKLVATRGRGYGFISLFFQRHFDLRLLDKIPPTAFFPQPKVFSRFVYFRPRMGLEPIINEEKFWSFIKLSFKQPRRTIKNNLQGTVYLAHIPEEYLLLRAQQLTMQDLLVLWGVIVGKL
jgi:16S rRNA (adenine1518-N6/adenine1519-N6)-dimethyltransferase